MKSPLLILALLLNLAPSTLAATPEKACFPLEEFRAAMGNREVRHDLRTVRFNPEPASELRERFLSGSFGIFTMQWNPKSHLSADCRTLHRGPNDFRPMLVNEASDNGEVAVLDITDVIFPRTGMGDNMRITWNRRTGLVQVQFASINFPIGYSTPVPTTVTSEGSLQLEPKDELSASIDHLLKKLADANRSLDGLSTEMDSTRRKIASIQADRNAAKHSLYSRTGIEVDLDNPTVYDAH